MSNLSKVSERNAVFSFITPAEHNKVSYTTQKHILSKALQKHDWFNTGELLDTYEKGVIYPVIHFTEFKDLGTNYDIGLLEQSALGSNFTLQQGLYSELHKVHLPSFIPNSSRLLNNVFPGSKAYIFLGFKSLENTFSEVLEESWKDWTGARLIYLNLSDDFGLSRLSFYRRVIPNDVNMFMYILLVECSNVNRNNKVMLLDFVQRLRVERMMGYLSVYGQEDRIPSGTLSILNGEQETVEDFAAKVDI